MKLILCAVDGVGGGAGLGLEDTGAGDEEEVCGGCGDGADVEFVGALRNS